MNNKQNNHSICVIGGDGRMLHCARGLAEKGYNVSVFGFENSNEKFSFRSEYSEISKCLEGANAAVLPLPISVDGITLNMPLSDTSLTLPSLFSLMDKDITVFGGNVSQEVYSLASKFGIKIIDYFEREELKIANAQLTAESALEIAMSQTEFSLSKTPVLVIGYGRIGKALCRLLKAMDCEVYASARKCSDKAWIRAFGYSDVDTGNIQSCISRCKLIFNTVPYMVLDAQKLGQVDKDCLIIDLASKPGGVDFENAKKEKLRVIWALALPGKKLRISAGKVISDTIISIIDEEDIFL